MAKRSSLPCRYPGCGRLVSAPGYCETHKHAEVNRKRRIDERRGSSTQRGYGYRWSKAAKGWLLAHPLCAQCERQGRVTAGVEVDHIIPHRGDQDLFWDSENWQSLCKPCHSRKTAREDGGFATRQQAINPG